MVYKARRKYKKTLKNCISTFQFNILITKKKDLTTHAEKCNTCISTLNYTSKEQTNAKTIYNCCAYRKENKPQNECLKRHTCPCRDVLIRII